MKQESSIWSRLRGQLSTVFRRIDSGNLDTLKKIGWSILGTLVVLIILLWVANLLNLLDFNEDGPDPDPIDDPLVVIDTSYRFTIPPDDIPSGVARDSCTNLTLYDTRNFQVKVLTPSPTTRDTVRAYLSHPTDCDTTEWTYRWQVKRGGLTYSESSLSHRYETSGTYYISVELNGLTVLTFGTSVTVKQSEAPISVKDVFLYYSSKQALGDALTRLANEDEEDRGGLAERLRHDFESSDVLIQGYPGGDKSLEDVLVDVAFNDEVINRTINVLAVGKNTQGKISSIRINIR